MAGGIRYYVRLEWKHRVSESRSCHAGWCLPFWFVWGGVRGQERGGERAVKAGAMERFTAVLKLALGNALWPLQGSVQPRAAMR